MWSMMGWTRLTGRYFSCASTPRRVTGRRNSFCIVSIPTFDRRDDCDLLSAQVSQDSGVSAHVQRTAEVLLGLRLFTMLFTNFRTGRHARGAEQVDPPCPGAPARTQSAPPPTLAPSFSTATTQLTSTLASELRTERLALAPVHRPRPRRKTSPASPPQASSPRTRRTRTPHPSTHAAAELATPCPLLDARRGHLHTPTNTPPRRTTIS